MEKHKVNEIESPEFQSLEKSEKLLIISTIECVSELGYQSSSVRAISKHANLSPGMVRHCFDNKLEMVVTAYRCLAEELIFVTNHKLEMASNDSFERLSTFIHSGFSPPILTYPKISFRFALWGMTQTEPEIKKVHTQLCERYKIQLEKIIHEVANKKKSKEDREIISQAILTYLNGVWVDWLLNRDFQHKKTLYLADEVLEKYLLDAG
ncbi:TetR/AcrR family transcriptional regulator [Halomonas halocynthiae]|uniref:TetR/AcrR family transcriptional regulator n=1 Tax=Halomonas halocynthiae TaxID=176290 RepID=UPI0004870521|nr:TetR family transcriptional regulator C-terminal domain-containing protein [Halomonas halocynthiae]